MTATTFDGINRLTCAVDPQHDIGVIRAGHELRAYCVHCEGVESDLLASTAWYDSHQNLSVLVDWLGDMSPSGHRHVIEKPWRYEDEWRTATAARDHEHATDHQVCKDGMRDDYAYCDSCGWTCTAGDVQWVCPFCECLLEDADDLERKAHLADVGAS